MMKHFSQIITKLHEKLKNLKSFMRIQMTFNPPTDMKYEIVEILNENRQNTSTFFDKLKEENIAEL
jgi:hypothetical protein